MSQIDEMEVPTIIEILAESTKNGAADKNDGGPPPTESVIAASEKLMIPPGENNIPLVRNSVEPPTENLVDPPATKRVDMLLEKSVNLPAENGGEQSVEKLLELRKEPQTANIEIPLAAKHNEQATAGNHAEAEIVVSPFQKVSNTPDEEYELVFVDNNSVLSTENRVGPPTTEKVELLVENDIDLPDENQKKPPAEASKEPQTETSVDPPAGNRAEQSTKNPEEPEAESRQDPIVENLVGLPTENYEQRNENLLASSTENREQLLSENPEEPATQNPPNARIENGENQEVAKPLIENGSDPKIQQRLEPTVENRAAIENRANQPVENQPATNRVGEIVRPKVEPEYDETDDELDETIIERIYGLGEMFHPKVRSFTAQIFDLTWSATKNVFWFSRHATWYIVTTSIVLFAPMAILTERAQLTEMEKNEQKQVLLGPLTAMKTAGAAVPPLPSRV